MRISKLPIIFLTSLMCLSFFLTAPSYAKSKAVVAKKPAQFKKHKVVARVGLNVGGRKAVSKMRASLALKNNSKNGRVKNAKILNVKTARGLKLTRAQLKGLKNGKVVRVAVQKMMLVHGRKKMVTRYQTVAFSPRAFSAPVIPERLSMGQLNGLHRTPDPLDLKSSVALVVEQNSERVLFDKNSSVALPIASITKLMTAMVVLDAKLPLNDALEINALDVDTEKNSRSRLRLGSVLTRNELLLLALMSSENRAASALGRNYPGGVSAFVTAMNLKAQGLGMENASFHDSTGLSSQNRASARDLLKMVNAAYKYSLIRQYSTTPEHSLLIDGHELIYRNSNALVKNADWNIGLQKTGYISEAGRCLVMQATIEGKPMVMVFLDSQGKYSRLGDAARVRKWLSENESAQDGLQRNHVRRTDALRLAAN